MRYKQDNSWFRNFISTISGGSFGTTQGLNASTRRNIIESTQTSERQDPYLTLDQAISQATRNLSINNSLINNRQTLDGSRKNLIIHYTRTMKDAIILQSISKLGNVVFNYGYRFVHKNSGNQSLPNSISDNLNGSWFNTLLYTIFETEFYGASLLQFLSQGNGLIRSIIVLDRARVNTLTGRFNRNESLIDEDYVEYNTPENQLNYLEILLENNPNSVGLLDPLSRLSILKQSQLMNWASNNKENTVVRLVFTGGRHFQKGDDIQMQELYQTLQDSSKTRVVVLKEGEKLESLHSETSFTYQTFERFIIHVDMSIRSLILHSNSSIDIASGVQESLADKTNLNFRSREIQRKIEFYVNEIVIPRLALRPAYTRLPSYRFEFEDIPLEFQSPADPMGGSSTGSTATGGQGSGSAS